jgi:hypothetical protein
MTAPQLRHALEIDERLRNLTVHGTGGQSDNER